MGPQLDRRHFLGNAVALAGLAADRLRDPRATSGDRVEPAWAEQLAITVGPDKGDLIGRDDKVLQAAIDLVARLGGGTVKVLPGTFRLRNAVRLASGVRLAGSGPDSRLVKEASVSTKLTVDSDWYDQEITLVYPAGFRIGDGICLRAKNPHSGATTVIKRTLVARSGSRFKLDRPLRENLWQIGDAHASTLFPIVTGENIEQFAIEDLVLDGNKGNNDNLDGNYAGCIFLQDCRDVEIRRVTAHDYNGDGISWQICHDVVVEACISRDHAGLGLHPGSGSQRPIIRHNHLVNNDIGLFFCWGVRHGLAEDNLIEGNRGSGISIGHRDTDNLIRGNTIRSSGKVGVLFRPERGPSFAAHRNRLLGNTIIDSGAGDGVGIDIQGGTEQVTISDNRLSETRHPEGHVGVRLGRDTKNIKLEGNQIDGFAVAVADLRNA